MRRIQRLGYNALRPILMAMDAEAAHRLTIRALQAAPLCAPPRVDRRLEVNLFGLSFPNPVGLAAGFDKNGEVPTAMLGLGFGFVEVGTTTPKPQVGNTLPRLFRLREDGAVINRMGFNNEGHDAMLRRLASRQRAGIVGVNIGANKDSTDRMADYAAGVRTFGSVVDYLTVNISSPNTPGLRTLQSAEDLKRLLGLLNAERAKLSRTVPMLLKIAPDLIEDELRDVADACVGHVDGVIISNTTTSRPPLLSRHAHETGGLSGVPLFQLSTQRLAQFFLLTKGAVPLIGAGGIRDVDTAISKIEAGASLLQVYSALVFKGPGLVTSITDGLLSRLGGRTLSSLVGSQAEAWAHQIAPGK